MIITVFNLDLKSIVLLCVKNIKLRIGIRFHGKISSLQGTLYVNAISQAIKQVASFDKLIFDFLQGGNFKFTIR